MGVKDLTSYLCFLHGHEDEAIKIIRQNREAVVISNTFLKALPLQSDMHHWSRAKEAFTHVLLVPHTMRSAKIIHIHLHFQSITSIPD